MCSRELIGDMETSSVPNANCSELNFTSETYKYTHFESHILTVILLKNIPVSEAAVNSSITGCSSALAAAAGWQFGRVWAIPCTVY